MSQVFSSFLSTQCICVKNGYLSDFTVTSGGQEGSVFAIFMFAGHIIDLPYLIESNTYLFADDTNCIGSQLIKKSLEFYKNKAIKWSIENRWEFNMAKFHTICFCVKKLDQCSVHLYADDTEITCKSSLNDLCIIITIQLKLDNHINQRLSNAQQKFFFPFYNCENEIKFILKLHSPNSALRVKCMVLQLAKLQRTEKDAKTSAQVGFY